MQQNKKLAPKIQQTGMYKFKQTLIHHAKKHNIRVKEVQRDFPSTLRCSSCGYKNIEMKDLSKRVFRCPDCGLVLDRDVNASYNLKAQWDNPKVKFI